MLAPVLARLSELPGVTGVHVECTGTFFLLELAGAAALEPALSAARDVLGPAAAVVDGATATAQLTARARGELWFSKDGIRGLSYLEGRLLAGRVLEAVAATVPLDRLTSERLLEASRAEIFAALDHAHDTGGRASSGWFEEAWPSIAGAIAARLDGLAPELRTQLEGALRADAYRTEAR